MSSNFRVQMKFKTILVQTRVSIFDTFLLLNTNLVLVDDIPSWNVGVERKKNWLVNIFRGFYTDPRLLPQPLQMSPGACGANAHHLYLRGASEPGANAPGGTFSG